MKNRVSIAALLATSALAMGIAQPAFSADTATPAEPVLVAQAENDAAVRGKVEAAIAGDTNLHGASIMVDTKDGIVLLSGEVSNEEQREAAGAAAAGVEGVSKVMNELAVAQ